jgi:hypothetical protein
MRSLATATAVAATIGLGLGLGLTTSSHAKQAQAAAKPPVDPEAISALHKMGEFLRSRQIFAVQARITTDDVIASGQKVQFGGTVELRVRRPDRMRMDIAGDRRNEHIYYDGKTFTVYGERVGYYASFPAPATLAELKDVLEKRYAFDLPLADLFYWGTDHDGEAAIQAATRVGAANIDGFMCDHFAFRNKDVDWELWIEQGGRPVPRKEVITTTAEKTKPQHTMVLSWDLSPKLEDQMFTFVPPASAHQIEFDTVDRRPKGGVTP